MKSPLILAFFKYLKNNMLVILIFFFYQTCVALHSYLYLLPLYYNDVVGGSPHLTGLGAGRGLGSRS